jgi:hypothetical protein
MLVRCSNKLLLCTSTLLLAGIVHAALPVNDTLELPSQLKRRLTAAWQGQELGTVLERIATSQDVDIWLDRRVDPQQQIDVRVSDAPLADALSQITAPHMLGWSSLGGIIYVGPRESASELATLAELAKNSLSRVPAKNRERWLAAAPAEWPRLSEPREILTAWLENAGVRLANPDVLSHDLWNAKTLPPLSLVDKVVLLLVGFDQACEILPNGQSCLIVPIRRPVVITKSYETGRRTREFLAEFKENPTVSINRKGNGVAVTGRWEDHEHVAAILKGTSRDNQPQRQPMVRDDQKVFSLRLTNQPVGKVIDQLANQLGLTVSWSRELLSRPLDPRTTLVSCDVSNGNLAQLLEGVLSPAGFEFKLKDKVLEISPAQ